MHSDWMNDARCGVAEADALVPEKTMGRPSRRHKRITARAVEINCHHCPVITQCLAWAVANGVNDGVWGGLLPRERNRLVAGIAEQGRDPVAVLEALARGRRGRVA